MVATGEDCSARQLIRSAAEISSEAPHSLLRAPVRSDARAYSKMPISVPMNGSAETKPVCTLVRPNCLTI